MLIENQKVKVKWGTKNKKRLVDLGYNFTKMGDFVDVNIKDVTHGCKSLVWVKCDYCDKLYQKRYKDYWLQRNNNKDCCANCVSFKRSVTNMAKYGGNSSQCDPNIREKSLKTQLANGTVCSSKAERTMVDNLKELYGSENCFPQFLLDKIVLDCLLVIGDIKIDVEYDGKYFHQDTHKDIRRDYFTKEHGIKVLRFKGNYIVPTKQQIQDAVDYLINNDKSHLIIDLEDEEIIWSHVKA